MCPTCPSVPETACSSPSMAHLPTSAPFRVRHTSGIRPVIHPPRVGGPGRRRVVSRRLSATGIRLLGILFPPGSSALLTVGLPDDQLDRLDPDGVPTFRTHKIRPGWAPSVSRDRWCSPGWLSFPNRHRRLPRRPVLRPAGTSHLREARLHETSSRVHVLHPSGLPLACDPWMEQGPLGFTLGFRPRGHPRRPPGRGRALSTGSELQLRHHRPNLQSLRSLAQCDFASHRTPAGRAAGATPASRPSPRNSASPSPTTPPRLVTDRHPADHP